MMPTGLRFNPTDEELIEILQRKVNGQEMPFHGYFIVQINIYEFDPQDLQCDQSTVVSNTERFCYFLKDNNSREVLGRGWWRATGHLKKIYCNGRVVGYKRPLTFYSFTNNDRDRKKANKTKWIMHEYSLESNTTDWRLCRIKYNGRQDKTRNNFGGNSNSITGMQPNIVGEQSEPQPLQLTRLNEHYFDPMQQFGFVGESSQLENVYFEPYFTENMQMEMTDKQQLHQAQASFYPPYNFDDQLDQPADSFEQQFPSL